MRTMDEDKARRGQGQGQDDAVAGAGMECWNMPLYLTLVLDWKQYASLFNSCTRLRRIL